MSIPNEALQKLALEIESQAVNAQREINIVKAAIAEKQKAIRITELTLNQFKEFDANEKVYEGVGKMFVATPQDQVQEGLNKSIVSDKSDISDLNKKLHYLETTYKNSREHIEKIMKSGRS